MPTEYVLSTPPPVQDDTKPVGKKPNFPIFILAGCIVVLLAITIGYFLGKGSTPVKVATTQPTPTPASTVNTSLTNPSITPSPETPNIAMLPDKQYFEDSYIVIAKTVPHETLVFSVSRVEQKQNFSQYTRVNYFDGKTWERKTILETNPSGTIATNLLLSSWNDQDVVSRFPEKNLATIVLPSQTISFTSHALQNEISLQSLPGSTKFMYQGDGTITIDDQKTEAYVYYSRTYSFNASDLSYLLAPSLLSSQWMVFWDADGTFYHLDSHAPKNPTGPAQVLRIGVRVDRSGVVKKTNLVSSTIATNNTTQVYKETFGEGIDDEILLPLANTFDKSNKKAYTWYLTTGEGSAIKREGRTIKGIGLIEHIVGMGY